MIRPNPKLWIRLWVAYTLVAFLGVLTLLAVTNVFFVQARYSSTYTQANLEQFLAVEIESGEWLSEPSLKSGGVDDTLSRLLSLQRPGRRFERTVLDLVSNPEAAIELKTANGELLFAKTSDGWEIGERREQPLIASASLPRSDHVLTFKLHAPFSLSKTVASWFSLLLEQSIGAFLISTVVGLLCGIVAARYITRRLSLMDDATQQWSQGNFVPKIELASGDELGLHAERLNAMSQELESHFSVKQALVISNERTRLARDLHDTVKQNLFALGLQLASLRERLEKANVLDESKNENLAEAEQINRDAQEDIVEIIAQLRTSEERNASLGEILQANVSRLRGKLETEVGLEVLSDIPVSPIVEVDLVRAVGELVTNAVRHGKADKVQISLNTIGKDALIQITDNGSGFNPDRPSNGMGLQSVAERIATLPVGQFTISSKIGEGASAQIQWSHNDG